MALTGEKAKYFRDELRNARAATLRDAEEFLQIVIGIERLGSVLRSGSGGFGKIRHDIHRLTQVSPFGKAAALDQHRLHSPFPSLYDLVRVGRNTAVHEGAYARHLASKSIELALLIESALSAEMSEIGDYMVSGVVTVAPWHPVSFARQTLLANSFSFLPIWVEHKGLADWHLISDRALAKFVRNAGDAKAQVERLAMSLEVAIRGGELQLAKPLVCGPNVSVIEALEQGGDLPILVHGPQRDFLLGIATAFDLL